MTDTSVVGKALNAYPAGELSDRAAADRWVDVERMMREEGKYKPSSSVEPYNLPRNLDESEALGTAGCTLRFCFE